MNSQIQSQAQGQIEHKPLSTTEAGEILMAALDRGDTRRAKDIALLLGAGAVESRPEKDYNVYILNPDTNELEFQDEIRHINAQLAAKEWIDRELCEDIARHATECQGRQYESADVIAAPTDEEVNDWDNGANGWRL